MIQVFLRTIVLRFPSEEGPWGPPDCGPGAVRTRGRSGVRLKNVTLRNGPRPKRRIFRKNQRRGGGRRVAGTVAPGRKGRAGRRRPDRRATVRGPEHRHQAVSGILLRTPVVERDFTGRRSFVSRAHMRAYARVRVAAKFKFHRRAILFAMPHRDPIWLRPLPRMLAEDFCTGVRRPVGCRHATGGLRLVHPRSGSYGRGPRNH